MIATSSVTIRVMQTKYFKRDLHETLILEKRLNFIKPVAEFFLFSISIMRDLLRVQLNILICYAKTNSLFQHVPIASQPRSEETGGIIVCDYAPIPKITRTYQLAEVLERQE